MKILLTLLTCVLTLFICGIVFTLFAETTRSVENQLPKTERSFLFFKQHEIEDPFRFIPKAELHLHLGGAYPLEFLLKIATPQQSAKLLDNLELVSKGMNYQSVFQVFSVVSQIVNSDSKVEEGTYALCQALKADGVVYAEIRTGLKDLGNGAESYLQSVLRGMERAQSTQFTSNLLLSLQRSSSLVFAKQTVDLALQYKDRGVVGLDISGDSTVGNIDAILPEIVRAKEGGLFLTAHMGESPLETDQKRILEALHPDRIGHGVHLSSDALHWILNHRLPIEVCLTSSFLVQMTNQYAEHPALQYRLKGYPIVICTDDPLLFQTTLSKEFQLLSLLGLFSEEEIQSIAEEGFKQAFDAQRRPGL